MGGGGGGALVVVAVSDSRTLKFDFISHFLLRPTRGSASVQLCFEKTPKLTEATKFQKEEERSKSAASSSIAIKQHLTVVQC